MKAQSDISIIIATHNRCSSLRKTLGYMAKLDREGINAEFIVVDNNSTDAKNLLLKNSQNL
jgi:glycosyltransferase involved in cell wall biosynthesis